MFENTMNTMRRAGGYSPIEEALSPDTVTRTVLNAMSTLDFANTETLSKLEDSLAKAIKQDNKDVVADVTKQIYDLKKLMDLKSSKDFELLENFLAEGKAGTSRKDSKKLIRYLKQLENSSYSLNNTLKKSVRDVSNDTRFEKSMTGETKLTMAKQFAEALATTDIVNKSEEYKELLLFLASTTKIDEKNSEQLETLVNKVQREVDMVDSINDLVEVLQDTSATEQEQATSLDKILVQLQVSGRNLDQLEILKDIASSNKSFDTKMDLMQPALEKISNDSMKTRLMYSLQQLEHKINTEGVTKKTTTNDTIGRKLLGLLKDKGGSKLAEMKEVAVQWMFRKIPIIGDALSHLDMSLGGLLSESISNGNLLATAIAGKMFGGKVINAGKKVAKYGYSKITGKELQTVAKEAKPGAVKNAIGYTKQLKQLKNTKGALKTATKVAKDFGKSKYGKLLGLGAAGYFLLNGSAQAQEPAQQYEGDEEDLARPEDSGGIIGNVAENFDKYAIGGVAGYNLLKNPKQVANVASQAKNLPGMLKSVGSTGAKGVAQSAGKGVAKTALNGVKSLKSVGGALSVGLGVLDYAMADNSQERTESIGSSVGGAIGAGIGLLIPLPGMALVGGIVGSTVGSWVADWFTDPWDQIPDYITDQGKLVEAIYIDQMVASPEQYKLDNDDITDLLEYQKKLLKDEKALDQYITRVVGNIPDARKPEALKTILDQSDMLSMHPAAYYALIDYVQKYAEIAKPVAGSALASAVDMPSSLKGVSPEPVSSAFTAEAMGDMFTGLSDSGATKPDNNIMFDVLKAVTPIGALVSGVTSLFGGSSSDVDKLIQNIENNEKLSQDIKDKLIDKAKTTNSVEATKEYANSLTATGVYPSAKGEPAGALELTLQNLVDLVVNCESVKLIVGKEGLLVQGSESNNIYNQATDNSRLLNVSNPLAVGAVSSDSVTTDYINQSMVEDKLNGALPPHMAMNNPGRLTGASGLLAFPNMSTGISAVGSLLGSMTESNTSVFDVMSNFAGDLFNTLGKTTGIGSAISSLSSFFSGSGDKVSAGSSTSIVDKILQANNISSNTNSSNSSIIKSTNSSIKSKEIQQILDKKPWEMTEHERYEAMNFYASLPGGQDGKYDRQISQLINPDKAKQDYTDIQRLKAKEKRTGKPAVLTSTTTLGGTSSSITSQAVTQSAEGGLSLRVASNKNARPLLSDYPDFTSNLMQEFLSTKEGSNYNINSSDLLGSAKSLYKNSMRFRKDIALFMYRKSNNVAQPISNISSALDKGLISSSSSFNPTNAVSVSGRTSITPSTTNIAGNVGQLLQEVEKLKVEQSKGSSQQPVVIPQQQQPKIVDNTMPSTNQSDMLLVFANKQLLRM